MTSDLKCLRCRYTWKRRTWNRLPRQCPNCHRNDWNKPEVGPVGRPPLTKPVENKLMESTKAKGVEAIVRKRYDDAVASLVRGPTPQDDSTDDLLNHLLEQIKREDT